MKNYEMLRPPLQHERRQHVKAREFAKAVQTAVSISERRRRAHDCLYETPGVPVDTLCICTLSRTSTAGTVGRFERALIPAVEILRRRDSSERGNSQRSRARYCWQQKTFFSEGDILPPKVWNRTRVDGLNYRVAGDESVQNAAGS